MPERPLVIAHRGSSAAVAEHTLAAYMRAIDEGADGVECDVRLTRDGHLVCVHDGRLNRTSDGRGRVSTRTLAELDELDFGSWHPNGWEDGRAQVLTLDALLGAVQDAGRPLRVFIETKHPTRYGGSVEVALGAMLRRHGLDVADPDGPVQVTLMSFSVLAVRRFGRFLPTLPSVMLLELLPPGLPLGRLPFGAQIAGPGIRLIRSRPRLVERLRSSGYAVYVWTVNDPADIDLAISLGVDAMITDRPGDVLAHLAV